MDDDKVSVNVHQSSSNRTFCERLLADVSMISILVFVALFFRDFTLTMVIPVIPKALHLEDNAFLVSVLVIIKSVSGIITSLVFKPYFDSYLLPLFCFGFASLALAQLFFILSTNYYVWLVGRIMVGFAAAFLTPCGLAIIQHVYKEKAQRARIMGYVGTGSSLATVIAPAVAGILYDVHHTLPFVFVALIGLVALPFAISLMRTLNIDNSKNGKHGKGEEMENQETNAIKEGQERHQQTKGEQQTDASSLSSLESGEGGAPVSSKTTSSTTTATKLAGASATSNPRTTIHDPTIMDMLRDRETSMLFVSSLFMSAFIVFLESSVGVFLEGPAFHFSATETGLVYWGGLAEIIGSVASGHLCSVIGASNVLALGLFIQGLFIALGPKSILAVTIISISVQGMGFALAMNSVNQALSLVSEERFGGTATLYNMDSVFSQFGIIVGPLIGGYLSETIGFQYSSLAFGGIEVIVAVMFAMFVFFQYIPKR